MGILVIVVRLEAKAIEQASEDGTIVSAPIPLCKQRLTCNRAILGFPRMGRLRDLKKATEAYWGGKLSQADLLAEGKRLRLEHWKIQNDAGVDIIPSNDFSYYDQVLDHIQLFGVSLHPPWTCRNV